VELHAVHMGGGGGGVFRRLTARVVVLLYSTGQCFAFSFRVQFFTRHCGLAKVCLNLPFKELDRVGLPARTDRPEGRQQ